MSRFGGLICGGLLVGLLAACSGSDNANANADAGAPPPGAPGSNAQSICLNEPWCDTSLSPAERTRLLLAEMTLAEKISLLAGDDPFGSVTGEPAVGTSDGVPRVGIPRMLYSDGPVGPRKGQATAHPAPALLASTFNEDLAYRSGRVIGNEVRLKGADVVHGPTIDILRTPLAGRSFESYGEDPWLTTRLGVAWIQGAQSEGVIANVKHYVANNQEGQFGLPPLTGLIGSRFIVNAIIDERTLREIHLAPFEAAVIEADAGSIMCAYNRVNDRPACSSPELLQDILRDEWGFDGYVVTDYFFAQKDTVPSLRAGLDLEMPIPLFYAPLTVQLNVISGRVSEDLIDERVGNVLRTMFRFGIFDRAPFEERDDLIDQAGHAALVQEVAEAGIVLLQNDGILPLDAASLSRIAIIGEAADRIVSGGGSSSVQPFSVTTPLQGITARAGNGVQIDYNDGSRVAAAATLASTADVALVFVAVESSEGADRPCLAISCPLSGDRQDALIEAVAAANPRTIVVMQAGTPVLTPWRTELAALLQAWYPGQEGGTAIARILFGDVDPGGRLSATFPNSAADLPTAGDVTAYPGLIIRANYREGVLVGYRWWDHNDIEPAFAFGHGLSYTRFEYSNLRIDGDTVRATVRNSGSRSGRTVAQLYLGLPSPGEGIVQPPWQLRGYQPLSLAPGASTEVVIPLPPRAFEYWDVGSKRWRTAPGTYRVAVGESSRDLRLMGELQKLGSP
jgi:beta-glucosidase